MRLATFNVENLDSVSKGGVTLAQRIEILRPQLERLEADVVCLQEVNGQRQTGKKSRSLEALNQLLSGPPYERFHRVSTTGPSGVGVADVHNLVVLSRFPILSSREIRHTLVPPLTVPQLSEAAVQAERSEITFDRPLLHAELCIDKNNTLHVFNAHLRAPLAAVISGQKESAFVWKSTEGWAEGYYHSALKRVGQALELRLAIDQLFDADPHALISVAGDLNAEDHETPLKILMAAEEDTGNGALACRSLVALERSLPDDRRYSVLHHGRPQMLDHILTSRPLLAHFRAIEIHNETLGDELVAYGKVQHSVGSYHAPLVAEFSLG